MSGSTNFPASLDSHTSASPLGFGEVNNQAYTLSTAAHTNSVTTITVASTSAFPTKGYLVVKRELISYTGKTGTTFTGCTRGVGGTTAAAFGSGTLVEQVPVAANHNDLAAALVAVESHLIVMPGAPISVNSNLDWWQRSGGASVTSTTTYSKSTSYCADRLFVLPVGASVTQARSTTVPDAKSRYSVAVTGASSVTTVDIGQRIEAAVVNTRCLQSLVFSCYVRNESGAAFTPTLRVGTPGSADNFGTVTNRLAQTLQECADSAWTRVYHVFDPSAYTNIANGMEVVLRVPSGSLVSGDTVRVAQFDLRPGIALAAYAAPDPVQELLRCLRYHRKNIALDSNPATANLAQPYIVWTTSISNNDYYVDVALDPPMRSAPTVVTFPYTTPANTGRSSDGSGTDYGASSASVPVTTAGRFAIQNLSGGALTVAYNKLIHVGWTADAEL